MKHIPRIFIDFKGPPSFSSDFKKYKMYFIFFKEKYTHFSTFHYLNHALISHNKKSTIYYLGPFFTQQINLSH